jgi:hypothetical protein
VTKAVSDIVDSGTVSRDSVEALWVQYESVFTEIAELVATQLMLSTFEDLGYADRKAVLSRTEKMIESWAASGSHLRRSRDGSTPIKDALDRICHLADEIALLESVPRGARRRP